MKIGYIEILTEKQKLRPALSQIHYFFIRCICACLVMMMAGCSIHRPSAYHPSLEKRLSTLSPNYISTPQGHIEYYAVGKGTPVVLIPGYATDVSSWNRQFLATLAQHHQVFILNNRNVGGSITSSSSYQSGDLANDTCYLIQTLKLKKPAVIGISMGGMIAQKLAVLYPDTLGYLILINTSIAGEQAVPPSPQIKEKLLHLSKHKFGLYLTAIHLFFPSDWKLKMAYSLAVDRFQPAERTEIDAALVIPQQQKLVLNWLDDNSAAKQLKKLKVPTLILNGEADAVIPPANSQVLAKTIPHSQLIRWKEGGHAMIYQYPEEMGNKINNFIANSRHKN